MLTESKEIVINFSENFAYLKIKILRFFPYNFYEFEVCIYFKVLQKKRVYARFLVSNNGMHTFENNLYLQKKEDSIFNKTCVYFSKHTAKQKKKKKNNNKFDI